jgi:glyoxylase-like metal-dependent hydrolase (beta-lactamase superfamily II)
MLNIRVINQAMPLGMGSVNCYLLQSGENYFLIDSGLSSQRDELEKTLEQAGCKLGDLKLVILTHGDFDHTGNAAYLRVKHGAKIAMHPDDWGMLQQGDMFWNRKKGNALIRWLAPKLIGFGKAQRVTPDLALAGGFDLGEYGLEARVLSIPGHSKGSIGVLTSQGELFCGDLLENTTGTPRLGAIVDDAELMKVSVERLKGMGIKRVYPGHGQAFGLEEIR